MIKAHLFNPSGKWKYEVDLDYDLLPKGTRGWVDPHDEAREALRLSTAARTSGVKLSELKDYWTLVVIDPPCGYPIMVKPSAHDGQRDPDRARVPGDDG